MGKADHYRHNSFNRICDRSGFKVKAGDTRMEWTGHIVRKSGWEPRHPQDFMRGKLDKQSVPHPRPESDDDFLTSNEVTVDDL